jgi:DNA-binding LacI/PurR family transcriptional regulator
MPLASLRPATSSEVAARAGVSRATVSFVLNNARGQTISEATRQRVLDAARDLGYTPHAGARSLAGGTAGTVALVIPKAAHLQDDAFIGQLFATVNAECHRHGLKLLIEATEDEGQAPGGFVRLVQSRRIDGLIVVNPRVSEHEHIERLRDAHIPMVVFGAELRHLAGAHVMGNDNGDSARIAVQHLLDLGHRHIAYVSFARNEYHSVQQRERGWRLTLQAAGIEPGDDWVEYGDISAQSGYEAMQRLLGRNPHFTALFAGNDTIAFGAMRALAEAGRRVPEDVAVVGYDDIPLAAFAHPPLTTLRSDPARHGREAVAELLLQLGVTSDLPRATFPHVPELVVRGSCGAVSLAAGQRIGAEGASGGVAVQPAGCSPRQGDSLSLLVQRK